HREIRGVLRGPSVARAPPVDQKAARGGALERQRVADRHRFDIGNRLELVVDALDGHSDERVHVPEADAFDLLTRERDRLALTENALEREHTRPVPAELVAAQPQKAVYEEFRADQQN